MIYSPEIETQYQNQFSNHNYIIPSILFRKLLTLSAPILLHHVLLARSSSSLPMLSLPSLSNNCLSFLPPGGPGPPSPPSPKLTPFPPGPRQQPASMSGTRSKRCFHSDNSVNILFLIFYIFDIFLVYGRGAGQE
jgi:hypothetical protein